MFKILVVSFLLSSCKLAKFSFKGGQQGAGSDAQSQSSSPGSSSTRPDNSVPLSSLPDAAVEVEQKGVVSQSVLINQPVIIRPSSFTVDTVIGIDANCANKGIVRAVYTIDAETKTAERKSSECTSLGVPFTFTAEGSHKVAMQVFTPTGQSASASLVLNVVTEATSTSTMQPSFTILATPLFSPTKETINFSSTCLLSEGSVSWDFGDKQSGSGVSASHSYASAGQFLVNAICTSGSTALKASTTVVVLSSPSNSASPSSSPPSSSITSPSPSIPAKNAPSQNSPTQNNPIQNNPVQNKPAQTSGP